jgi:hypothetical protein
MNRKGNYYNQEFEKRCGICVNIIRPSYPYDFKCKLNKAPNATVEWYGVCDIFEKDCRWDNK